MSSGERGIAIQLSPPSMLSDSGLGSSTARVAARARAAHCLPAALLDIAVSVSATVLWSRREPVSSVPSLPPTTCVAMERGRSDVRRFET